MLVAIDLSFSPVDKSKYQNHKNDKFVTIEISHINSQQRIDSFDEGRRITWQICVLLAFYGFRSTFMRCHRRFLTHSIDNGFIYNFFSLLLSVITCPQTYTTRKVFLPYTENSLTIFVPYLISAVLPRPQEQKKKNLSRHNKPHYFKVLFLVYILIPQQEQHKKTQWKLLRVIVKCKHSVTTLKVQTFGWFCVNVKDIYFFCGAQMKIYVFELWIRSECKKNLFLSI